MEEIHGLGGTLMDICAEAPGFFGIETESGEPMGTLRLFKVNSIRVHKPVFGKCGRRDGQSMNYPYHLVYQETEKRPSAKCIPNV